MTLRAIVVDDEPLARDELTFLLGQCKEVDVVGEACSAAEARKICDAYEPEIAFIDLRMPDLDGIALGELLRQKHPQLDVVIVSAHDDGALRGFETQITDYLLKPVRLARLRRALGRVTPPPRRRVQDEHAFERFAVRRRGRYVVVELRDVVYFEARDELVWAVTDEDRFALDTRLGSLARALDPELFIQSHRSCIVRIDRIRMIEPTGARSYRLTLDHPESPKVPLARDRASTLRQRIPFTR